MKHLDFKTYMKPDQIKKHKKKAKLYDGRTKEGKKFIKRILDRRAAREATRKLD